VATKLTSFASRVTPHVLGCPDPAVEEAIRDSCIEFCERSLYIQDTLDPVDTVAGQIDYDLEPPSDTLVAKIMRAWYKDVRLGAFSTDVLTSPDIYSPTYAGFSGESGEPATLFQKDEATFTVLPAPSLSETAVLTVRVALKPTRTCSYVNDTLYNTWADTVACGARARLMAMPNQSWSNIQLSLHYRTLFEQGVNRARRIAEHGMVRSPMAVESRPFV